MLIESTPPVKTVTNSLMEHVTISNETDAHTDLFSERNNPFLRNELR